jgi:hypothetical protein
MGLEHSPLSLVSTIDRFCGLVFRVPGYRFRGTGFHSRRYQIFWEAVGLERGPLSLVSTTHRLFGIVVRVSAYRSRGTGFHSRRYQIFWEAVGLERGPLSLASTIDRFCGLVFRVPGYRSRGPGFDSRRYQICWQVVGLERGPPSLMSTIEELLGWGIRGSGLEIREYACGYPPRWPLDTLYRQKLTLASPTSGGLSVGIVRSRTQATESSLDSRRSMMSYVGHCPTYMGWLPFREPLY